MNIYEWHCWFAWYPVRLVYEINEGNGYSWADSGNYAWWCWVECCCHSEIAPNGDLTEWWEYREITK